MIETMVKKIKCGKNERYTFGKIDDEYLAPNLLAIQKETYQKFLDTGISEILNEFSPVVDYSGKAKLYFLSSSIDHNPKYNREECKRRGTSYTTALKVKARFGVED